MSDEVKNRPQLRVGLINEILSQMIFIRMDQGLWKFFSRTTVLLLCRYATLQWDTIYIELNEVTNDAAIDALFESAAEYPRSQMGSYRNLSHQGSNSTTILG
jgi:hypothetical protein